MLGPSLHTIDDILNNKKLVITVSGPSAVGKSSFVNTLNRYLLREGMQATQPRRVTTRPQREVDEGSDYKFVDQDDFHRMVHEDTIVAQYRHLGELYGFTRDSFADAGQFAIFSVGEMQGIESLAEIQQDMGFTLVPILLTAEKSVLQQRLANRIEGILAGQDDTINPEERTRVHEKLLAKIKGLDGQLRTLERMTEDAQYARPGQSHMRYVFNNSGMLSDSEQQVFLNHLARRTMETLAFEVQNETLYEPVVGLHSTYTSHILTELLGKSLDDINGVLSAQPSLWRPAYMELFPDEFLSSINRHFKHYIGSHKDHIIGISRNRGVIGVYIKSEDDERDKIISAIKKVPYTPQLIVNSGRIHTHSPMSLAKLGNSAKSEFVFSFSPGYDLHLPSSNSPHAHTVCFEIISEPTHFNGITPLTAHEINEVWPLRADYTRDTARYLKHAQEQDGLR
ncbi:MAG: hypothetical protein ACMXYE_04325 [Candidatus Woesearchaeota archaeon]